MRKIVFSLLALMLTSSLSTAWAWEPDLNDKMQLEVQGAIIDLKARDPGMEDWFKGAAGYAVFPKVGKGAIGVGGAHGNGLVIAGDKVVGKTSMSQLTLGLSLGGQAYAEFIFFRDDIALGEFKRGNYEMNAQASAVIAKTGASADASYNKGVAIFTNISGGVMADASVGGQKFTFEPVN
ncbi:MAG TPA: lipid-binding SYLF domain-containing protein [Xanthomonadales bacterium]|nr:lipid-binding SYLF domain-containing protein [Xanthomonadales bacterium]